MAPSALIDLPTSTWTNWVGGLPGRRLDRPRGTNITFKGRGFAWVNHVENRAMIKAHHDERDALLAAMPAVYGAGWTTNSSAWVRVRLELADPEAAVFELMEEAWRMTATKRAIKAFDEARETLASTGTRISEVSALSMVKCSPQDLRDTSSQQWLRLLTTTRRAIAVYKRLGFTHAAADTHVMYARNQQ